MRLNPPLLSQRPVEKLVHGGNLSLPVKSQSANSVKTKERGGWVGLADGLARGRLILLSLAGHFAKMWGDNFGAQYISNW